MAAEAEVLQESVPMPQPIVGLRVMVVLELSTQSAAVIYVLQPVVAAERKSAVAEHRPVAEHGPVAEHVREGAAQHVLEAAARDGPGLPRTLAMGVVRPSLNTW